MVAVTDPASLQISCFKIQENILERCQCVIDPDLSGRDCEIFEELPEIYIVIEKAAQAVGQLDRVGFSKVQEDLAGLQVLTNFPNGVG